jgi:prolipoprotein diacylglyceryl transferase
MVQFSTIIWDFPKAIDLGFLALRFYSLLFALGFFLGYRVMLNIFKREGIPQSWLDQLLTYMVVATIVGARLGHVFFYQWDYYKEHPLEILMIWEGGLASHGAALAIIAAMFLYSRKVSGKSVLWILDRVVITVALAGCFIRLGNMANSEIYGKPGNSAVETVFVSLPKEFILNNYNEYITEITFTSTGKNHATEGLEYPVLMMEATFDPRIGTAERAIDYLTAAGSYFQKFAPADQNVILPPNPQFAVDPTTTNLVIKGEVWGIPRYPTQIIEALGYFLVYLLLWWLYLSRSAGQKEGFLFGSFLVLVFGFRFFIEYMKEDQVAFESTMALNMGQWLSVPLVVAGAYFIWQSLKKNQLNES